MTSRILLVDDDPILLRTLARALSGAGYTVAAEVRGDRAMALIAQQRFDVALIDYELGRLCGLEVLGALAEAQPGCVRLVMTGHRNLPIEAAVNHGRVGRVIMKRNVSVESLVGMVGDALLARRREVERTQERQSEREREEQERLLEDLRLEAFAQALQPIVQVFAGERPRPVAYEALLRPRHPAWGGPLPVIRAAERHGRAAELSALLFRQGACWLDRMPAHAELFVNLHTVLLADPERLVRDLAALQPYSDRVVLEITEERRLQDFLGWERSVQALVREGYRLAIDDLGAGYNSLAMLADLQPHYIKLDMDLVRRIHDDPRRQRLVQLLATFGEATQAQVIAEGVETAEEADTLLGCGVRLMQGFHFGRPSLKPAFVPRGASLPPVQCRVPSVLLSD